MEQRAVLVAGKGARDGLGDYSTLLTSAGFAEEEKLCYHCVRLQVTSKGGRNREPVGASREKKRGRCVAGDTGLACRVRRRRHRLSPLKEHCVEREY
jgi:hypothetical protein